MDLAANVQDLRCFVPSRDFATSKRFYTAVGFREVWSDAKLALFKLGPFTFFLQDYFVLQWAANTVLDLTVAEVISRAGPVAPASKATAACSVAGASYLRSVIKPPSLVSSLARSCLEFAGRPRPSRSQELAAEPALAASCQPCFLSSFAEQ